MEENGVRVAKERSRRYPAQTITDADYDEDIALLANTDVQAEFLQHSLERAAADMGLHVNTGKTCACALIKEPISPHKMADLWNSWTSSPWKQHLINWKYQHRTRKTWTAIDRLSVIPKSALSNKIKRSFSQAGVLSILLYGCTTWTLTKRMEKKLYGNYKIMLRAVLYESWRQHLTKQHMYGHLLTITKIIAY